MKIAKGKLWVQVSYSFWSKGSWESGVIAGHANDASEFERGVTEGLREDYGDLGFVIQGVESEIAK